MTHFAKPLLVLFTLWTSNVFAINPLVLNQGMADSHVHFWPAANSYFMYATHDYSPQNTGFRMDDWNVWSSPDLIAWTLASTLYPNNTPTTNPNECWATDGATKNGNYYFYLSIGPGEVAVVNSTAPAGPWEDTLKTPLLNSSLGNSLKATFRDPCVFYDAATTNHYLIAGVFDYFIMRLGEDMMSLAEAPQPVVVRNPTGPYGAKTDDKPFLHFFNGNYYLSWGCFYGMSDSVYGPFDYKGSVINTTFIDPAFRMNRTDGPWYGWEDLADRHGSFFENTGGQWFYSSNDRSHSSDTAHPDVYRDTVLGYVHYYSDGTMAPVAITATGVGEYVSSHIEAENYMALSGGGVKGHDKEGRFGVHGIRSSTRISFPHVKGGGSRVVVRVGSLGGGGGTGGKVVLNAATAGVGGLLPLCTVDIPVTGAWDVYQEVGCTVSKQGAPLPNDFDLLVTFEGEEGVDLAWLDSLSFLW